MTHVSQLKKQQGYGMNNEMNPYKDLGNICDPTDQEYDPLTGSWVPNEPGFDWLLAIAMLVGCVVIILLMVWL